MWDFINRHMNTYRREKKKKNHLSLSMQENKKHFVLKR